MLDTLKFKSKVVLLVIATFIGLAMGASPTPPASGRI